MEKLKKVSRAQWCLFALFIGFAFLMQNCQDDDAVIYEENQTETELNARPIKVTVCRYNERKGTYSEVSLLEKRVLSGDVVIDADGDGYAVDNECGLLIANGIDLDDSNPAINPGAVEICGDGIDNNCDGVIDEGCTTYVPDDNFEQALIDLDYDDEMDDYVITANINTVTYLSVAQEGINDLTGIEGFEALEILHCWNNNLTSLDLSQNTALITLVCANNALTSIDVSNCVNLDFIDCNGNLLTSLNLSDNTILTYLACTENQLSSLDLSYNTALLDLQCNINNLVSLNISNCLALEYLYCDNNQLSSLDVGFHTALVGLYCGNNNLSSINVNSNIALQEFDCYGNHLTNLDVSDNIYLTRLYCYSNSALYCIQVNSNQLATAPADPDWWKDWDTVFSLDCSS